eukprot:Plantae.Rhodophyta-Hildenbrandia_rubra.ctg15456.p1 GENE.Plantae.Rhodophyta-Hildenbrandia_rubra.ctg15456~~Plantae.Rhodophyta-Hildenbrandia_rubra.ctg15456.p1  ORF type:complete len:502 (-),score=103.33 Plantae.Rhodophyta-Hildenbrandia_rubra.ctg15456:336-1841(-)
MALRQAISTGLWRRALSTAALAQSKPLIPPKTGGIMSSLKNVLGRNADPLPPDYKVDSALLHEVPTKVTTLPNGLRVASETNPVGVATVGIWIDAGTRFEAEETNGAAHFLEHCIFKGTSSRSQRSLEVGVEDIGAHLNAYTSREQTVYFARAMKGDVGYVMELLADILQNSDISESAVNREREVILREMEEIDGVPEEVVFDYLHETAYQGSPLGRNILGPVENIQKMTREDLKSYVRTHYKPHRMVLAGAGDIEHEELVKMAEKLFGNMKADPNPVTAADLVAANPSYLVGSDIRHRDDDMPLAHFAVAFESCGWAHPDAVSFMVLQALMGDYDPSVSSSDCSSYRIKRRISEFPHAKKVTTFNTTYSDTGLFGTYVTGDSHDLDDLAHIVMNEMIRPCFRVDEDHLRNAKAHLKTSFLAQMDGTTASAEEIGRQLLVYGRRIPIAEWFARIDAVDSDAVKRICNKYFYDREIAIAAMGPIYSLPDHTWIRRKCYHNRY